jgi:hypothetical protein
MARQFATAGAFKTSLETRLKGLAQERKLPLHTLRKVVIERLRAQRPVRPGDLTAASLLPLRVPVSIFS